MNNITEHIEILTKHNHWRRCNDEGCGCSAVDVKKIGLAIDAAIEVMQASAESEPVCYLCFHSYQNGLDRDEGFTECSSHEEGSFAVFTTPQSSDAEAAAIKIAGLTQDAERYRWLNDNGATFWTGVNTDNEVKHHVCEQAMDVAIDKAIKESK